MDAPGDASILKSSVRQTLGCSVDRSRCGPEPVYARGPVARACLCVLTLASCWRTGGRGYHALGMDRRTCVDDARTQAAVERKFEIIGEALNRLRRTCPEIAFLHRARLSTSATSHGYAIVRPERVWNYAENDLPAQGSAGATCRDGRAGGMSAERRLAPDVPAEENAVRLYVAVPSGGRVCLSEFEAAEKRTERRAMAQLRCAAKRRCLGRPQGPIQPRRARRRGVRGRARLTNAAIPRRIVGSAAPHAAGSVP